MKNFISLFTILLFSFNVFSQSVGDFRSLISGNWDNIATWERYDSGSATWEAAGVGNNNPGQIPTSTTNLTTVQANHTVTVNVSNAECGNLVVDANGKIQTGSGTSNQISIYGNLTNNGELNFYSGSDGTIIEFAGTVNASFDCSNNNTNIYEININKDVLASTVQLTSTGNFLIQGQNSSAPQFLTLTTGTFRLSGSFTMSSELFIGGAAYSFNDDEGFWLDNSNFTITGQDGTMQFNGLCHISAGTFNVGNTAMQRFYLNNNDVEFIMEGGELNITGPFYADDLATINISGGTINVASMQVTTDYWYCFNVSNTDANFTMSGGTINLINTNQTDREVQINTSEATTNITGGTLNIGTSATDASDLNFEKNGRLPNLVVDNTSNVKTAIIRTQTWIYDNLIVNGIMQYRPDAGATMHVYGDLTVSAETASNTDGIFRTNPNCTANRNHNLNLYGNLVVNGHFDGYIDNGGNEGRVFAIFRGTSDATLTGTGATCEFYDIEVNKGTDMSAIFDIQRAFTMPVPTAGANKLSATNGTLKLSGTETINISPYYNNQNITSSTGKFWMTNPNLTINWVNGGRVTSNGEFIIDAGTLNSGGAFLINGSSTVNNQKNGGTINTEGDFDMEQDVLMTGGTINAGINFVVDANGADEYGDLTL